MERKFPIVQDLAEEQVSNARASMAGMAAQFSSAENQLSAQDRYLALQSSKAAPDSRDAHLVCILQKDDYTMKPYVF